MDQKKIEDQVLSLLESTTRLEGEVQRLDAQVRLLISLAGMQIAPDNADMAAKQLVALAAKAQSAVDVTAQQRQQLIEMIDALRAVKKHGFHES